MKLLAGLLFLVVMVAVYGAIGGSFPGDGGFLLRYGVVALLSFVAILAHELGHAAVVLLVRGRIRAIVAFPFSYRVVNRKLALKWRVRDGEIGGYVAYDLDRINARSKHAWIALAGPLANAALAGAMTIVAAMVRPGLAEALATALAILSCGMAVVNLIPFAGSDGSAILKAYRTRPRPAGTDRST
jgi:Zn-dependent protease